MFPCGQNPNLNITKSKYKGFTEALFIMAEKWKTNVQQGD